MKEQTGIFADQGGFDITVGKHTQLEGAVIASTAEKAQNSLDTGTLGWTDTENKADYKAQHSGGSVSNGGPVGTELLSNAAAGHTGKRACAAGDPPGDASGGGFR